MSGVFYEQTFGYIDGYVVKEREKKGGNFFKMGSILDPREQVPVMMSMAQSKRPVFVQTYDGINALRGVVKYPEDPGKDHVKVV